MKNSEYTFFEKGMMSVSDSQVIDLIVSDEKVSQKLSEIPVAELARMSYREFRQMGASHQRAIRLVAAFEINRRKSIIEPKKILCSSDAYNLLEGRLADLTHEEFWTIYLNRSNRVIKEILHTKGGISGTVTDTRLILKEAILLSASSIVCCHNHPSGNIRPSKGDEAITKKIKDAAELMDIKLLDHVIISNGGYFSFADEGLI